MADEGSGATAARTVARVVLAHEAVVRLGPLTIAPALRQIVHADGRDEIVEPKVMEVLVVLLRADGAILTRDELCAAAWEGRIVGDDAINRVLARLRRLSAGLAAGVFRIETITKVGYRLVRLDTATPPAGAPVPAESFVAALAESTPRGGDAVPPAAAPTAAPPAAAAAGAPEASAPRRGIDRRVVIGGAVVLAAAAGAGGWWWHRGVDAAADSVAVLPFANLSGDPAQAYFSDGIAEELRSALTRIVRLKVAARTSSEIMRNADAPTAAAKLGVANIVTGSVRRGAGTIRVSAQLIDGATGLVRWSDSYDRSAGDALAIETGIATSVADALNIVLGRAEKALLTAGGTTSAAAHDAFLRGSALEAEQKFEAALPAYMAAVAADPGYALARAGLASVMANIANESVAPDRPTLAMAEAEARRAVALAPRLGLPLAVLGFVLSSRLDLRDAATALATAVQLAPGDAFVLTNYALFLVCVGRGAEAIGVARRAQALDPLRPNGLRRLGGILFRAGRLDDAIQTLRQGVARLPGDIEAKSDLSLALIAAGQPAAALALVATMPPAAWQRQTDEAIAAARLGDRAASDRALARLQAMDDTFYQIAEVHAQRGETDAAFAALGHAYAVIDPGLIELRTDPMLRPLHGDPRFAAWLRRVGFP
jgi:serine/threonine-protein kinase